MEKGEKFLLDFYELSKYSNLNDACYYNFDLIKLPAHQNLLRFNLYVQIWSGNNLQPTNRGREVGKCKGNQDICSRGSSVPIIVKL